MFKGYEANDDGLSDFHADFKTWCNELKKNEVYNINYSRFYSHHIAVENIFKRFYSNRPKNFGEHSGLGLNIVKNIIELHKGKIKAINRKDVKGAKIEVILPKYV